MVIRLISKRAVNVLLKLKTILHHVIGIPIWIAPIKSRIILLLDVEGANNVIPII